MKQRRFSYIVLLLIIFLTGCKNTQLPGLESSNNTDINTGEAIDVTEEAAIDTDAASDIYRIVVPEEKPENETAYKDTCSTYMNGETFLWVYTYDDHNSLLSEEKLNAETGERESIANFAYIYNEQDLVEVQYWNDPDKYDVFLYNELGLLIESYSIWNDSESSHSYYEYDEHGNEISEIKMTDGEIVDASYREYEYDEQGDISVSKIYDTDKALSFTMHYEYNENHQVIKILTEFEENEGYNYYETYEYDENGNMIRSNTFDMDSEEPFSYTLYEYDASNRCTKEEQFSLQRAGFYGDPEMTEIHEYEDF